MLFSAIIYVHAKCVPQLILNTSILCAVFSHIVHHFHSKFPIQVVYDTSHSSTPYSLRAHVSQYLDMPLDRLRMAKHKLDSFEWIKMQDSHQVHTQIMVEWNTLSLITLKSFEEPVFCVHPIRTYVLSIANDVANVHNYVNFWVNKMQCIYQAFLVYDTTFTAAQGSMIW